MSEKKYTEEDLNKIKTQTKEAFNSQIPKLNIQIGTDNYHSAPLFELKIHGGDMDKVRKLALKITKIVEHELDSLRSDNND